MDQGGTYPQASRTLWIEEARWREEREYDRGDERV